MNKIQLGTTPVVRGAILSPRLDILPGIYPAMALFSLKTENDPAWKERAARLREGKKLDQEHNKLTGMACPGAANNTWTIAVRQEWQRKITSLRCRPQPLSASRAANFKLAASAEFIERAGRATRV